MTGNFLEILLQDNRILLFDKRSFAISDKVTPWISDIFRETEMFGMHYSS